MAVVDSVWRERDTTPEAIAGALRDLLRERHAHDEAAVPARVLNLVAVVDAEWSGEIANRLHGVGRYHASRTIVCAIEPRREEIDATVSIAAETDVRGAVAPLRELVIVTCGTRHLEHLDRIVDPLVVTDLATVVWAPHGHVEALRALLDLAQVVLYDSLDEPDVSTALSTARELTSDAYVVDLAWLRSTPWRERLAGAFEPEYRRPELGEIARVAIRHHPDSGASGLLLVGWLASRLGWAARPLQRAGEALEGRAGTGDRAVSLRLEPDRSLTTRGLESVELETAGGHTLRLDRGPGGLRARERERGGTERSWTMFGASRGEPGVLGEGIRQALLRDPTYAPALAAAEAMTS